MSTLFPRYEYNPENFNYEGIVASIIEQWRRWAANTNTKQMVLGMSGGKDSAVAGALAVEALGAENIFAVLMPNGEQKDIDEAKKVCEHLGICYTKINIGEACGAILSRITKATDNSGSAICATPLSDRCTTNLPARIRMSTIFAVAQARGAKVINTCNLSEDTLGWSTLFGDDCGAYAPLKGLTASEILAMAKYMELPEFVYTKAPSDGLCGKTDEESFGFSYKVLDTYIRTGYCEDWNVELKIRKMYNANKFKQRTINLPHPTVYVCEDKDHILYGNYLSQEG